MAEASAGVLAWFSAPDELVCLQSPPFFCLDGAVGPSITWQRSQSACDLGLRQLTCETALLAAATTCRPLPARCTLGVYKAGEIVFDLVR